MWRICTICGLRTDALVCDRDAVATEIIRPDTEFPGRLHRGDVLLNHYVVHDLIGVGGMGAVYRGQQRETLQSVAIKVLWADLAADAVEVRRFTREARAASLLAHPNAVRVIDFGSDPRTKSLFIIMEFLVGQKLSDILRHRPMMEPREVVHIVAQVCKALEEAHRKGMVHRDIKPDNIFVQDVAGERNFAKILDFGLVKFVAGPIETEGITRSGYVVGSPEYMAPEQASGSPVGPAADLYSVGVVLYECLTGRLPFDASNTAEILRLHILKEPPPLIGEPGTEHIPVALAEVVMRCLEKDPSARPPNADALRIQLLQACDRRDRPRPISGIVSAEKVLVVAPGSIEEAGLSPAAPGASNNRDDIHETVPLSGSRASIDPQSGPTATDHEVVNVDSLALALRLDTFDSETTPRDGLMTVPRAAMGPVVGKHGAISRDDLAQSLVSSVGPTQDDQGRESPPLSDALDRDALDPLGASPRAASPVSVPKVTSHTGRWVAAGLFGLAALAAIAWLLQR